MRRLVFTLLTLSFLTACTQQAEPRWLVRAFPGSYPEVVYFVPTTERAIAMTIDDGVDPETTPVILDILQQHDARATFFLVSDSVPGNEQLIARIVDAGHEIGHHMTTDEVTVRLPPQELREKFVRASHSLEAFATVQWFRPGSARYNDQILQLTRERGYRIALASLAPLDTIVANPNQMASYINWMIEPGSVVVLHDVGARGQRTAATLELLLPMLKKKGYSMLSLGQLDKLTSYRPDEG